ncbi:hypothetical protein B0G69_4008 [Paraburkholderia sp. RAU2J]|nr:hypothetical protein B0G69_4008 [Paraburkholderia sp. RAU2J]
MRSDHTATDLAPAQRPLAMPLDDAGDNAPRRHVSAFARVTFCFAWLFGLEPFLTGPADVESRSKRVDRH